MKKRKLTPEWIRPSDRQLFEMVRAVYPYAQIRFESIPSFDVSLNPSYEALLAHIRKHAPDGPINWTAFTAESPVVARGTVLAPQSLESPERKP